MVIQGSFLPDRAASPQTSVDHALGVGAAAYRTTGMQGRSMMSQPNQGSDGGA